MSHTLQQITQAINLEHQGQDIEIIAINTLLEANKKELSLLSAHALVVGISMVDQIPNSSLAPWIWLLAGVLLGRAEEILSKNAFKKAPLST